MGHPLQKKHQRRRCLWKSQTSDGTQKITKSEAQENESLDAIFQQFASRSSKRSIGRLCSNAVVVVQEFTLTCFLLARHRIAMLLEENPSALSTVKKSYLDASSATMILALFLAVCYSAGADQSHQQDRKTKAIQRTFDAALLAVMLRFMAAVLQSLTASYSSDTVQALALSGMTIHLLFCDYSYANGRSTQQIYKANTALVVSRRIRPSFQGGTVSLNAALFSTTLLVSRLRSGETAYALVFLSVVFFAFYPVTRHAISASYPTAMSGTCVTLI